MATGGLREEAGCKQQQGGSQVMLPQLKSGSPEMQFQGSILGSKLSTKNEAEHEGRSFSTVTFIYYYYHYYKKNTYYYYYCCY